MTAQKLREKLSAILRRHTGVHLVYLFGSLAEGQTGPMSGFDFAILRAHSVDGRRLQALLAYERSAALGTAAVDVVILSRAPIELAYVVIVQAGSATG